MQSDRSCLLSGDAAWEKANRHQPAGLQHDCAHPGQDLEYMVALQQSIVQASELQLAPEFEPGQRVEFHTADGQVLDASVVQINATHW